MQVPNYLLLKIIKIIYETNNVSKIKNKNQYQQSNHQGISNHYVKELYYLRIKYISD